MRRISLTILCALSLVSIGCSTNAPRSASENSPDPAAGFTASSSSTTVSPTTIPPAAESAVSNESEMQNPNAYIRPVRGYQCSDAVENFANTYELGSSNGDSSFISSTYWCGDEDIWVEYMMALDSHPDASLEENLRSTFDYLCRILVPDLSGACHSLLDQVDENPATPITVPNRPTNVIATAGDNRVTVTWGLPSSDGGSQITRYIVTATSDTTLSCIWTSGPPTCTVTGLENGTGYEFVVAAENAIGTGTASLSTPPATPTINIAERGARAIAAGRTKLGAAYVWAAEGPDVFDSSGFVRWAFLQVGISLPHYSGAMYRSTIRISESQLQPGDLVFWGAGGSEHVAIYIGESQILHTATGVAITPMNGWWTYGPIKSFGRIVP